MSTFYNSGVPYNSGSTEPLVPSEFLHSWWRQAPDHLAKPRQHDSHEFFLSMISTLHSNLTPSERMQPQGVGGGGAGAGVAGGGGAAPGSLTAVGNGAGAGLIPPATGPLSYMDDLCMGDESGMLDGAGGIGVGGAGAAGGNGGVVLAGKSLAGAGGEGVGGEAGGGEGEGGKGGGGEAVSTAIGVESCACPVHRAFTGMLRSDVTCKKCGHTSTVHDPTVGLSLDIPAPVMGGGNGSGSRGQGGSFFGGPSATATLEGCLRQFSRPEQFTTSESFPCSRCGGDVDFTPHGNP